MANKHMKKIMLYGPIRQKKNCLEKSNIIMANVYWSPCTSRIQA